MSTSASAREPTCAGTSPATRGVTWKQSLNSPRAPGVDYYSQCDIVKAVLFGLSVRRDLRKRKLSPIPGHELQNVYVSGLCPPSLVPTPLCSLHFPPSTALMSLWSTLPSLL